jgi:hypothetical protein
MNKVIDYASIEIDGIDTNDYPDFVDAFICNANYTDGTQLTDSDLDELNEDRDLVYHHVIAKLF